MNIPNYSVYKKDTHHHHRYFMLQLLWILIDYDSLMRNKKFVNGYYLLDVVWKGWRALVWDVVLTEQHKEGKCSHRESTLIEVHMSSILLINEGLVIIVNKFISRIFDDLDRFLFIYFILNAEIIENLNDVYQ